MAVSTIAIVVALLALKQVVQVVTAWTVSGVPVHSVPLQRNDEDSPYCLVASTASLNDPTTNFLATQVWPSARLAASAVQKYLDPKWVVSELGCGPGMPSLTAAKLGASRVIATDLDLFALKLVEEAAAAQKLKNIEARQFDLTSTEEPLPPADLYLLSDVFESGSVARGAAYLTDKALANGARVWVFAQQDRVQREDYLEELCKIRKSSLSWETMDDFDPSQALWLCDVDEAMVNYG